jgi:cell wall-associated NlpC family hydrolase
MTQNEMRAKIVAEARSWIGTPYMVRACVKGPCGGCDCSSILMGVAINCGMMAAEEIEVYTPNCWDHWTDEKYRLRVMRYAKITLSKRLQRADQIKPGSILLTRTYKSKFLNHGAIVVAWPRLVQSVDPKVEEIDASNHPLWRPSNGTSEAFDFNALLELPWE